MCMDTKEVLVEFFLRSDSFGDKQCCDWLKNKPLGDCRIVAIEVNRVHQVVRGDGHKMNIYEEKKSLHGTG